MDKYVATLEREVDRITTEWRKAQDEVKILHSCLDGLRNALVLSVKTSDVAIEHLEKLKLELATTKAALKTLQSKL